jgi:arsenate reductase
MREVGIDLSGNQPQRLSDDLAGWADVVVTMGCGDECPYIPGKRYIDWNLDDPSGRSLPEVRSIRNDIAHRVGELASQLDPPRPGLPSSPPG